MRTGLFGQVKNTHVTTTNTGTRTGKTYRRMYPKKDGIGYPWVSAMALTRKFGPFPMEDQRQPGGGEHEQLAPGPPQGQVAEAQGAADPLADVRRLEQDGQQDHAQEGGVDRQPGHPQAVDADPVPVQVGGRLAAVGDRVPHVEDGQHQAVDEQPLLTTARRSRRSRPRGETRGTGTGPRAG